MAEYIDRAEVCRFCKDRVDLPCAENCVVLVAPVVDAVRVIRCKDCMHSKEAADEKMRGLFVWCDVCKRYKIANGFCDDGKKPVKIRKLEVYKK